MKKKIMLVAQSAGGVERYIKMLLKYIDKTKFECILVCSYDYKKENYNGLVDNIINVDMYREIKPLADIKSIIQIRNIIKKYKPDIVYMHSSKAGAIGRIANLGIKNTVLYNPHGWAFCMKCSKIKKIIYRNIERVLAMSTDEIIAISQCEKKRALDNKICNDNKIEVILNGIDIEVYDKKNTELSLNEIDLKIPKDRYIIGLVGRICDNKAPEIFIEAAKIIKKSIPQAFFILVGDGPQKEEIIKLIKKYSLCDSVLITGWIEEPLKYIDIFNQGMLLTRWEGFGLVLAEYMISNVPIIATNVDSIPEIIENKKNGFLVDIDDINAIAEASLDIYYDKEIAADMTKRSNKKVREQFDVKRTVFEHERLFEKYN